MNPRQEQVIPQPPEQLPFVIRPMAPGDVPAVVAIDKLSFPTPWPASSFLYELLESSHSFYRVLVRSQVDGPAHPAHPARRWFRWMRGVLTAPDGAGLTGYVGFRIYRNEVHISTIAIHPDWRGKGLGELLFLATMEKALGLGARRVTLEVRPSNRAAQQLYRKYGFQFTSTRNGYYRDGEDAWLMAADVGTNGYRDQLLDLRLALDDRLLDQGVFIGQEYGDGV